MMFVTPENGRVNAEGQIRTIGIVAGQGVVDVEYDVLAVTDTVE